MQGKPTKVQISDRGIRVWVRVDTRGQVFEVECYFDGEWFLDPMTGAMLDRTLSRKRHREDQEYQEQLRLWRT